MNATGRISEIRKLLDAAREDGMRVGFVPTMGALHEGHRSLIRRARRECGYVVVSIFVNPTQFNEASDLAAYPRTFADDLDACAAENVDLVFHPDADEVYPQPSVTTIDLGPLTARMEGLHRPGHFAGVALVVAKLFNIIGECTAYFGEKDAQQLRVVRRMAIDLNFPVDIVGCETVRDDDGLALSSRNARLDPQDRARALALITALREVKRRRADGERDAVALAEAGRRVLEAAHLDGIDYLEVVDPETLEPLQRVDGPALVCGAVHVGDVRLIDNLLIGTEEDDN